MIYKYKTFYLSISDYPMCLFSPSTLFSRRHFPVTVQGGEKRGMRSEGRESLRSCILLRVPCKRLRGSRSLIVKKKNPSFCVKPSYCLQIGVCTKNGEGRMEMSEKCQMPAGCVRCALSSWNVLSGDEGPGQGDRGGSRSHLLMTNKTTKNLVWMGDVKKKN